MEKDDCTKFECTKEPCRGMGQEFAAAVELVLHPHHALMDARPDETTWQARSERLGINRQNRAGDSGGPADAAPTDVPTG